MESSAAVRLTTGTFAALNENPRLGRAEAFRQSMLNLIDNGASPPIGHRSSSSVKATKSSFSECRTIA